MEHVLITSWVVLAQIDWGSTIQGLIGGSLGTVLIALIGYMQFSKQWRIEKQNADSKVQESLLSANNTFIQSLSDTIVELRESSRVIRNDFDKFREEVRLADIRHQEEINILREKNRNLEDDNSKLNRRVGELIDLAVNLCRLLIASTGVDEVKRRPEIMRHPEMQKVIGEYNELINPK